MILCECECIDGVVQCFVGYDWYLCELCEVFEFCVVGCGDWLFDEVYVGVGQLCVGLDCIGFVLGLVYVDLYVVVFVECVFDCDYVGYVVGDCV